MKQPQRASTLPVKIGGDTWQDVLAELERIADHVPECGPKCQLVSGGVSCGSLVTVEHDPEMTSERFHLRGGEERRGQPHSAY